MRCPSTKALPTFFDKASFGTVIAEYCSRPTVNGYMPSHRADASERAQPGILINSGVRGQRLVMFSSVDSHSISMSNFRSEWSK